MQRDQREQPWPWIALLPAALLSGFSAGCGAPAAPLPPTLNLPQPVRDLAAVRAGDIVHLTFSVPQKTTDKLPVRGPITATLCRSVDTGPCQPAGTLAIPAQAKSASMDDALPPELRQGPPRLLVYKVAILNHAAKSFAESAPAWTAAGAAPAPVTGLTATPRRNGIMLSWHGTAAPADVVRFDRTRTSAPPSQPESKENNTFIGRKAAPEEPAEQVLRVPETASGHLSFAVDTTAHTGSSYRYVAQRVQQVTLGNRTLDVASSPALPVETAYRDVFPPPVPTGLVSASDTAAKAIDLDWTPDVDPGLAGYIIYRRVAGSNRPPERISAPGKPVTTSSWSDTSATPGQRYAYSVSAIDTSGNESRRSAEIEDEWNPPVPSPNPQP
ncbi:MAG TPA: hypothetical protein VIY53_06805 [Acidobacteriaceae bacterium]